VSRLLCLFFCNFKISVQIVLDKLGLQEILKEELAWLDGGLEETNQPKASGSGDRLEFMSQFQSNTNMLKLTNILKNIKKKRDKTACEVVQHQKQPPVKGQQRKKPQRKNVKNDVRESNSSSSSSSDDDGGANPFLDDSPHEEEPTDDVVAPNPLEKFAFVKQPKKVFPTTSKTSCNIFDQAGPSTSYVSKGLIQF
jgi:hypothetical protein